MRLFGLIGFPLSHSFSEKYFTEKFEKEGIRDCRYSSFPLSSIQELPSLLKKHPDLSGLNITIPYKKDVIAFLDHSGLPEGLNACNCIRIHEGKLTGFNTDWTAFRDCIQAFATSVKAALVLGSGGAAEAILFALAQLGIKADVVSRKKNPAARYTYQELDEQVIKEHQLIINTTPLGQFPVTDQYPGIPYEALTPEHYLFDVVYNPSRTLFLQKGEQRGARIMNGAEMLVLQAEESWKIWNS